jgi:hypothetical protein
MGLYFEQELDPGIALDFEKNDLPGFQEWLFFDFVTHTGERIIELFIKEMRTGSICSSGTAPLARKKPRWPNMRTPTRMEYQTENFLVTPFCSQFGI